MRAIELEAAAAGVEVMQPLLDAGLIDISISTLTAYQTLGRPEAASCCVVSYGALMTLEDLLSMAVLNASARAAIVTKLRGAGTSSFRYILDHPLANWASTGFETGTSATVIAAMVWGRDEAGALEFAQADIDKLVDTVDGRGSRASISVASGIFPMQRDHMQGVLNLCISDSNKQLLLDSTSALDSTSGAENPSGAEIFLSVLADSLLLDPAHPRRAEATFEAVKAPVQRDAAEALQQLVASPLGKVGVLKRIGNWSPRWEGERPLLEVLQEVADRGWTREAQQFARGALFALSEAEGACRQHAVSNGGIHVMLSYQWDHQAVRKFRKFALI